MDEDNRGTALDNVIRIDDERIKGHLDRVVRGTVEETLNALLDAEADRLCNAQRYERTEARRDTRAGHYERSLETKAGEVTLKVPKLRRQTFETAIIERYRRREASVEEALIEMYLAGVSVRRVEDITEALWGTRVSPSTVSDLNKKIYATIETWRNRPIEGEHPYVYLDGIVMKRSWAGEVRNVSLLVAIAVNAEGYREILGIVEGAKEDKAGWSGFLKHLKERGLKGVRLIISDACMGLVCYRQFALGEARHAGTQGTGSAGAVHHRLASTAHSRDHVWPGRSRSRPLRFGAVKSPIATARRWPAGDRSRSRGAADACRAPARDRARPPAVARGAGQHRDPLVHRLRPARGSSGPFEPDAHPPALGCERFRRSSNGQSRPVIEAKIAKGEIVHVDASLIRANVSWDSLRPARRRAVGRREQRRSDQGDREERAPNRQVQEGLRHRPGRDDGDQLLAIGGSSQPTSSTRWSTTIRAWSSTSR